MEQIMLAILSVFLAEMGLQASPSILVRSIWQRVPAAIEWLAVSLLSASSFVFLRTWFKSIISLTHDTKQNTEHS